MARIQIVSRVTRVFDTLYSIQVWAQFESLEVRARQDLTSATARSVADAENVRADLALRLRELIEGRGDEVVGEMRI